VLLFFCLTPLVRSISDGAARYADRYAAGAQTPRTSTLKEGALKESTLNSCSLWESERRSVHTLGQCERTFNGSGLRASNRSVTRDAREREREIQTRDARQREREIQSDRSVTRDAHYADAAGSEAQRRHATYTTYSGSSWCLSAIGIPRH
jgi:hypothetical protein